MYTTNIHLQILSILGLCNNVQIPLVRPTTRFRVEKVGDQVCDFFAAQNHVVVSDFFPSEKKLFADQVGVMELGHNRTFY